MLSRSEIAAGGVLRVTVHYVYHPVTEETLRQVFEPYEVVEISVFQRATHVEAMVRFRSRHEAAHALALDGRVIYEGCCLLAIQDVSPISLVATTTACHVAAPATLAQEVLSGVEDRTHNLSLPKHRSTEVVAAPQQSCTDIMKDLQSKLEDIQSSLRAAIAKVSDACVVATSQAMHDSTKVIAASQSATHDLEIMSSAPDMPAPTPSVTVATIRGMVQAAQVQEVSPLTSALKVSNGMLTSLMHGTDDCAHMSNNMRRGVVKRRYGIRITRHHVCWIWKKKSKSVLVVSTLTRPPEPAQEQDNAPCHQLFLFEELSPWSRSSFSPGNIITIEYLVFKLLPSWQRRGFNPLGTLAQSGYLLHCSWTDKLSVPWDPRVLTLNWKVIFMHSLGNLKLLACACSLLDMPPWRHGGFSPGVRVCNCLLRALVMSEMTQWESDLPLICWLYAWETSRDNAYVDRAVEMNSHGRIFSTPENLLTTQADSLHIREILLATLELSWPLEVHAVTMELIIQYHDAKMWEILLLVLHGDDTALIHHWFSSWLHLQVTHFATLNWVLGILSILWCFSDCTLSVPSDPGVLQLVLCGRFKWKVTLVDSLFPLELLTSACIVLDIMPPWRRDSFSPGTPICRYLIICYALDIWDPGILKLINRTLAFNLGYFHVPFLGTLKLFISDWVLCKVVLAVRCNIGPGNIFPVIVSSCMPAVDLKCNPFNLSSGRGETHYMVFWPLLALLTLAVSHCLSRVAWHKLQMIAFVKDNCDMLRDDIWCSSYCLMRAPIIPVLILLFSQEDLILLMMAYLSDIIQ